MPVEVLCIGHAAADITVRVPEFPTENGKLETGELLEAGGGPAANAAWLLAAWGVRCGFAGLVGDDAYGRRLAAEFAEIGVDTTLLECRPGHATPVSLILVNRQNGSRTIVTRKAQAARYALEPARLQGLGPRFLLFDGHELEAARQALAAFPTAVTVLDAGSKREGTLDLANRVHYLVASERFARQLTGAGEPRSDRERRECLARLREAFPDPLLVAVTLGERGVVAEAGGAVTYLPAFPAVTVDTTGAGDVFHGAFVYALASSLAWPAGLRLAAMAASLSVCRLGGRPSVPSLAQVQEALEHGC
jgi:sugar/nucleoside kinase (ribokinase family)